MQRKTHSKKRSWHGVKNKAIASSNRMAVKLSVVANSVHEAMRDGSLRNRSVLAGALVVLPTAVQAFPAQFNLADLNGSNGFVINGVDVDDRAGASVSSAGDINGDGVDDLIIGAYNGNQNDTYNEGESYVVFGGSGVGSAGAINLSGLNGSNGFVLNGIDDFDFSGRSVSGAGDINGDGVDDLIIGAASADPNGNRYAGESYVVFGGSGVGSTGAINLSGLNGSNGFVLNGVDFNDDSGISVSSAGDINGDGVADLIIGARDADPNGNGNAGESYVVFGGSGVGSTGVINLSGLTGSNGFVLNGVGFFDRSGISVSGAGDINGDNVDDLIIGAYRAGYDAGESYVVFGGSGVGSTGAINLSGLNGSNGFVLNGVDEDDRSGASVSGAGDINGDGINDLIIGAYRAGPNGNSDAGESYVVFGGIGVGSTGAINLSGLDGSNGFVLNGVDAYDFSGDSVSGAGDINGDGVDDLIIGARLADPNGFTNAGASYVVFGGSGVGSTGAINLSGLSGSDGFVLNGVDTFNVAGQSVSGAGDINDDGVDDLIIGSNGGVTSEGVNSNAGESYVVFGQSDALPTVSLCNGLVVTVDLNLGQTPGPGDDVVLGTPGNDDIRGRAGNDTICGMGGNDFIHGNSGDDWIDGGDGVDNIRGGQGDDILFSGSGATVGTSSRVFGGTGDDAIFGGPDADDLRGGRGDDMISGEQGADSITGNEDDDILFGGPGADTLKGGNGENDELFGEGGADSLNGGSGSNDFCDGGGQGGDTDTNCEVI